MLWCSSLSNGGVCDCFFLLFIQIYVPTALLLLWSGSNGCFWLFWDHPSGQWCCWSWKESYCQEKQKEGLRSDTPWCDLLFGNSNIYEICQITTNSSIRCIYTIENPFVSSTQKIKPLLHQLINALNPMIIRNWVAACTKLLKNSKRKP